MAVKIESLTIRMNPKAKYSAAIGARFLRMSLSAFIEEALREKLDRTQCDAPGGSNLAELTDWIWAPHESTRFASFADELPHLLTDEERILWKLISDTEAFWPKLPNGDHPSRDGTVQNKLNLPLLKERWENLKVTARRQYQSECS